MAPDHGSGHSLVYELTVQDQPFHLALKRPARLLGAQAGFATNRAAP